MTTLIAVRLDPKCSPQSVKKLVGARDSRGQIPYHPSVLPLNDLPPLIAVHVDAHELKVIPLGGLPLSFHLSQVKLVAEQAAGHTRLLSMIISFFS